MNMLATGYSSVDRTPVLGTGGRQFEPGYPDKLF